MEKKEGIRKRKQIAIRKIAVIVVLMMILSACSRVSEDGSSAMGEEAAVEDTSGGTVGVPVNPEPEQTKKDEETATDVEQAKKDEETDTDTETNSKEDTTELTKEEQYATMVEKTLLSTGNNARLKKAIEKARQGEDVTIAYIGGSITEGANSKQEKNYVTRSYEYFRDTFAKDPEKVHLVNAGIGGTPSSLGVVRYERDVTEEAETPVDVLFIEFSVNDYLECTNGKAFEGLIRRALSEENKPAVVLLFSVFKSRWNMQDTYIPLGNYYDLPMVSIRNGVNWALDEEKFITDIMYFSDDYHPTDYGHQIMADCIGNLWDTVASEEMETEDDSGLKEALLGDDFENVSMITSKDEGIKEEDGKNITVDAGSFSATDEVTARFMYTGESVFPFNFKHDGSLSDNTPFQFTADCKNLLLVFKFSSSGDAGSVVVFMDGEEIGTYDSYNPGGWNNAETQLVFSAEESAEHTFEIRMKDGDEDKDFTILALGYSQ